MWNQLFIQYLAWKKKIAYVFNVYMYPWGGGGGEGAKTIIFCMDMS